MKNPIRLTLLILGIVQLFREIFLGFPIIGGSYIFSTGWAPLGTSFIIYAAMALILFLDRYNDAKSMVFVPALGLLFTSLAFIPLLGWLLHCAMVILLIMFVFVVINTRTHVGNTTKYNPYSGRDTVNDPYKRK